MNVGVDHIYFFVQGLSEDKQFISDSLLSRLQDDDPSVVACVLKLGQVKFHEFSRERIFNLVEFFHFAL